MDEQILPRYTILPRYILSFFSFFFFGLLPFRFIIPFPSPSLSPPLPLSLIKPSLPHFLYLYAESLHQPFFFFYLRPSLFFFFCYFSESLNIIEINQQTEIKSKINKSVISQSVEFNFLFLFIYNGLIS